MISLEKHDEPCLFTAHGYDFSRPQSKGDQLSLFIGKAVGYDFTVLRPLAMVCHSRGENYLLLTINYFKGNDLSWPVAKIGHGHSQGDKG